MHLSALSAVFKEQPVEEHFLKKWKMLDICSTIFAEQSVTKKQVIILSALEQCQLAVAAALSIGLL